MILSKVGKSCDIGYQRILIKPNSIYDDARLRDEVLAFSKQLEKMVEAAKMSVGGM